MRSRAAWWCAALAACAGSPPAPAPAEPVAPFVGVFAGPLRIHGPHGVREVPMGLEVTPMAAPPRTWRWLLRYGEGAQAQRRDYRLVLDDPATGACRIDERNGIELQARLCDGELVAVFAVAGQTLVTRYRAVGDAVEFALEAFAPGAARATGQGVQTVADVAVQRARLRRLGP